jgi:RimJ/RimL family protein N-acetyltransferase
MFRTMKESINTPPRLETNRLILRVPALVDLDRWAEMMADENAARFIGGVAPKTIVWRMIMQMAGAWELTGISTSCRAARSDAAWRGAHAAANGSGTSGCVGSDSR